MGLNIFPQQKGTDLSKYINNYTPCYSFTPSDTNYATILNVTGQGMLSSIGFAMSSNTTGRNIHLKVTVDGVVVFDKGITSTYISGSQTNGIGMSSIYNVNQTTGSGMLFPINANNNVLFNSFLSGFGTATNFTDGADISYGSSADAKGVFKPLSNPQYFTSSLKVEVKSALTTVLIYGGAIYSTT